MKAQTLSISKIPAIIWGERSDKVFVYVHGKLSCKEFAEDFSHIAAKKGFQTLSFDLPEHGERIDSPYPCDIWNGINDLSLIADYAFSKWKEVSLFACSLGAYFSLHAYADRKFSHCLFQSPILNMEYLIGQMFVWFQVTEEELRLKKEISTPVDVLRWDYYQYVKEHPIQTWSIPTSILYGGKDNLQSVELVETFAESHHCKLTISPSSEHPFMQLEDSKIVHTWLEENL